MEPIRIMSIAHRRLKWNQFSKLRWISSNDTKKITSKGNNSILKTSFLQRQTHFHIIKKSYSNEPMKEVNFSTTKTNNPIKIPTPLNKASKVKLKLRSHLAFWSCLCNSQWSGVDNCWQKNNNLQNKQDTDLKKCFSKPLCKPT